MRSITSDWSGWRLPKIASGHYQTTEITQGPALFALCCLRGAGSPTVPLFIAQVTTAEVVEYKAMKSKRMAAAVEEEGDLLTYSALAIRDKAIGYCRRRLVQFPDSDLPQRPRATWTRP